MKSERGQAVIVLALIGLGVLALAFLGLSASMPGMKLGADTIGNAVGNTIDNASAEEQEWRNLDWQMQNGTVMTWWVNRQRIHPNRHAVESHDVHAEIATNCYNDHGVFFIQANRYGDWYFHCLEEDNKTVRTTIWTRIGNRFEMKSAYTKGDGNWTWNQIRTFFEDKWGAQKATFPSDGVLYIDGSPAPFFP